MSPVAGAIPDLSQIHRFQNQTWGGSDGFVRTGDADAVCTQTTPTSLSVQVTAFKGFVDKKPIEQLATVTTSAVTPPSGGSAGDLRRIDLVQYTYGASGLNIKAGTEGGAPVAPDLDANSIFIALLYLRNGMSVIKTADDATNGYVSQTGIVFI